MALQYSDVVANQQGKTPDQLATEAQNAIAPNFNSLGSSNLQPSTPVNLPPIPPASGAPDALAASVASSQPGLQNYITSLTPPTTSADQAQQSILDSISSLTGQDTGKQQYELGQQQANGVPDLQKQLTDLNGQMTVGNAEYQQLIAKQNQDLANLGGNGSVETKAVLGAQQSGVTRAAEATKAAKASDLALIAARAQAVSGNIQTALTLAKNATDAKFAPIEDALKVRQAQLNALAPILSKQEKVQAAAQQKMLQDQQQAIADKKDKEKTIQNIMLQAAQSGADQATLDRIQNSPDPASAITAAGTALGADFRQKIAQQQFDNKLQLSQLAVSRANVGVAQARLNFDKTKEAFDEAVKLAGKDGQVTLDANGKPSIVPTATQPMQQALAKANIDLISGLTTDKGLNSAVGPNYFARFSVVNQLDGVKSNFIAGVEQLTSQLSLDSLIKAKSQGATFGALSEGEMKILSSSASKIAQWAIKKDGQVTGYNASEKDFRAELDKIKNFAKLDYVLKGGSPTDVNVKQEPDGTWSTINSDGSITNLGN